MSTDQLHETVANLVARLPMPGIPMPNELPALARRLAVLPLTWDMGGCLALRLTGEIVTWVWDEEDRLQAETAPLARHRAMF
jgi:hypothetical protein